MTEKQIRQTNLLRKTGAGYKKIAELTSLSRDTIRNFLKKNSNRKPSEQIEKKGRCKCCGIEIQSMPRKREYFPKGEGITNWTDEEINSGIKELNLRARKCLNYRMPYEEYYGARLLLGLANSPPFRDISKNFRESDFAFVFQS